MITTAELLAAVKTAQAIPSNYRLARTLDVPEKSVSRWNTGKNTPDDSTAARLAEMAGLDVGYVLASMAAERAAEGPSRALWASIADRLHHAPAALAALVFGALISGSPDAGAMSSTPGEVLQNSAALYIM